MHSPKRFAPHHATSDRASSIAPGSFWNGVALRKSTRPSEVAERVASRTLHPRRREQTLTLADLQTRVRSCVRCDALVRCRTQPVPGAGAVPAAVMFVGIAPGRHGGDRTGMPFSGDRSGKLLHEMIARARLTGVFITNLVRCNPRDHRGRNRDPDAREIANCRDHLRAELAIAQPRVIVCLGHIAWRELAGRRRPFTPTRPTTIQVNGVV